MLVLALDTCDSRGSIALAEEHNTLGEIPHLESEEYSAWLLPAVDKLLGEHHVSHSDLGGYAVASGPGSFTGVRVGLTTAKAWSEIYSKPIYPISRLALLAHSAPASAEYAGVFIDAQRSQIFAALYRRSVVGWQTVIQDSVISPADFFSSCAEAAQSSSFAWVSLDPAILSASFGQLSQQLRIAPIIAVHPPFAAALGRLALSRPAPVDALTLDANYVRRSDAEIFGKKVAQP